MSHIPWQAFAYGFLCGSLGLFSVAVLSVLIGERLK